MCVPVLILCWTRSVNHIYVADFEKVSWYFINNSQIQLTWWKSLNIDIVDVLGSQGAYQFSDKHDLYNLDERVGQIGSKTGKWDNGLYVTDFMKSVPVQFLVVGNIHCWIVYFS
jgi:hypothetical protein